MIMDLKIQDMEMMMESDGNKQRTAIATAAAAASCSIDDSNDKNIQEPCIIGNDDNSQSTETRQVPSRLDDSILWVGYPIDIAVLHTQRGGWVECWHGEALERHQISIEVVWF